MKPDKIIQILASILPSLTVFLASLFLPYDNDLGWHLAYGKYFFQNHQILRDNIFSTEMPGFHWVNSSWLTDLISYFTFNNFGFVGLAVLGAAVITLTFYFFAKAAKLDYFEKALIFPMLIYFMTNLNSVSFRGQLLSLLLLGILVYILTKASESHKNNKSSPAIYALPPLFALWSNLHGEFMLGFAIFVIWIASNFISGLITNSLPSRHSERSEESHLNIESRFFALWAQNDRLIVVFFASMLAVLVNPFGFGVYQEAFRHFGNPLDAYIAEWIPFKMLSTPWWGQVVAGFTVFFGILFLIFGNKIKENLSQISTASIVYLLSFSVRRFVWPMYYLILPLLAPVAAFFKPESKKYANITATVIFVIYLAATFWADNPLKRIQNMSWQSYCQKYVQCSDGAISYMEKNLDARLLDARLLTYYGWGGYLIWNYPQIKPSIDGRMHLWRDETGYSAFATYYAYEQNADDVDKSTYDAVLMSPQKPMYQRLNELVGAGKWQKAYEDKDAGVFVRSPVSF